jgi:hypothetical protein
MSTFQEVLAQSEENHKRELQQLKQLFQTELSLLKQQLCLQQQQAPAMTPTTNSTVEAKLDIIMKHLQLTVHDPTEKPTDTSSPPRKRRDQSATPTSVRRTPDSMTDEDHYPEPTLNWDSDDAEDDEPSSQDNAMALSGSED